jgi:hypothetical protein
LPAEPRIPTPPYVGSYEPRDITPLLTELAGASLELPAEQRERLMQNGGHYAETLPIEFRPTARYEELFEALLAAHSDRIALLTRVLARLVAAAQPDPVLVSLARAGTPVGVLLRRALELDGVDAPHYTVSIVRERGLDERALRYLVERHEPRRLVFVDGWTGKGAIQRELELALAAFEQAGGAPIAARLAVLADPAHVTMLCATRADELIPSACLNSTVSGLMSRTIIRPDLLGPGAFHGVRIYREFAGSDVSRRFVDTISARFGAVAGAIEEAVAAALALPPADGRGLREVQQVQREEAIADVHRVKPGIGETTRVLLRRVPDAILVDPRRRDRLAHVLMLAEERGVAIRERRSEVYACFGLIRRHEA